MRRILALLVSLPLLLLAAPTALAAHTVTVWTGDMDGWAFRTSDGGTPPTTATATFVAGPATPPAGTGSVQLSVGANGGGGAEVRSSSYAGTLLADITTLTYGTYVGVPGSGGQAPYLILAIDLDGDAAFDDLLFFEPLYQDGTFSGDPVSNQGSIAVGAWQDWDAAAGGWWSLDAGTFGPPLVTLDTYVAANPTATIVDQGALGGLRVVAGFGAGAWNNFVGNVDALVIGTTSHTTTYDFEVAGLPTSSPIATATPTPSPAPTGAGAATPTATPTPRPSPAAAALPDTASWASDEAAPVVLPVILLTLVVAASALGRLYRETG